MLTLIFHEFLEAKTKELKQEEHQAHHESAMNKEELQEAKARIEKAREDMFQDLYDPVTAAELQKVVEVYWPILE